MAYQRIAIIDAYKMITELGSERALVIDVRDEASFAQGHIASAQHIDNRNVQEFLDSADFEKPLFVCCYHGNMSQGSAAYMSEKGFDQTYSIDGGYEAWQAISGH